MAFLGSPYRIFYESVNRETGLQLISARILKPGSTTTVGPFQMTELPAPMTGVYYYDFLTDSTFPEGDYVAFVSSPMDGVFTLTRFSMWTKWATVADIQNATSAIEASIETLTSLIQDVSPDADVSLLLQRLTATRANLLDNLSNLDAFVSSRLPTNDPRLNFLDQPIGNAVASASAQTISDAIIEIDIDEDGSVDSDLAIALDDSDIDPLFEIELLADDEESEEI